MFAIVSCTLFSFVVWPQLRPIYSLYLTVFERTMCAYKVERSRWSYMLAPQLNGRAKKAFAAMEAKRLGDYDALKDAILTWYYINEVFRVYLLGRIIVPSSGLTG